MQQRTEWTPTQIAAHNAWEARRRAGMTLDEATAALNEWLSEPWATRANLGAYEAQRLPRETRKGKPRHRKIDVELIAAMSLTYGVSPSWFFYPPDEAERVVVGRQEVPTARLRNAQLQGLVDAHQQLSQSVAKEVAKVALNGPLAEGTIAGKVANLAKDES